MTSPEAVPDRPRQVRRYLPGAGLVIGVWAMLPPWVGPKLHGIPVKREVVDHIVPGIVVVAASVLVLVAGRRGRSAETLGLLTGMIVFLAGFWMTATHLPLVGQAQDGSVPVPSVVNHVLPGLTLAALGIVWSASYWRSSTSRPFPRSPRFDRATK